VADGAVRLLDALPPAARTRAVATPAC